MTDTGRPHSKLHQLQRRSWSEIPRDTPEDGVLLVSHKYEDGDTRRRLHTYEKDIDGDYKPVCGTASRETPHGLSPMNADEFVTHGTTCQSCLKILDIQSHNSDAITVGFDPFGVFEDQPTQDVPEIPDPPEEYVCPDCGDHRSSRGLSLHWAHPKSDCEYPFPSQYERDLLTGLWLAGGNIEKKGTHPILRKSTSREYLLQWLSHELGLWGSDVSVSKTSAEQREAIKQQFGDENSQSATQYRFTSRACPFLNELYEEPVSSAELTPLAARVFYTFNGNAVDNSSIVLRHESPREIVELLHNNGFTETSLYEPADGKNQWKIALSADNSRRFIDWIGGPLPGARKSKQVDFRDTADDWQGATPTKRVSPANIDEALTQNPTQVGEKTTGGKTLSLEPNWDWLQACLAKLGQPELAKSANKQSLTPRQVYGPVLSLLTENQDLIPSPSAVPTAE